MNRALIVCIFLMLALSACAEETLLLPSESLMPTSHPTPIPMPEPNGRIKMSVRKPATLNPIKNSDVTVDKVLRLVYEPLCYYDESFRIIPNDRILKSADISFDGLSAVICLKEDVFWHDGKAVTSDDVIHTLEQLTEAPDDVIYKSRLSNVLSYEKIDEYNVRLVMKSPYAYALEALLFPLIPKHAKGLDTIDGNIFRENRFPGNGRYAITEFNAMNGMLLSSVEPIGVSAVEVMFTPEGTDYDTFTKNITDVFSYSLLTYGKRLSYRAYEYPSMKFEFIGFNLTLPNWQKEANRKAIMHGMNKSEMVSVFLGHADETGTTLNPYSWLYADQEVKAYSNDLQTALSLYDGESYVSILVNEDNNERITIANILKRNLSELNIEATIETVPYDIYKERLTESDFDIYIGGMDLTPGGELSFLHSQSAKNIFGYNDAYMDALIRSAEQATSALLTKEAYASVQKRFTEKLPVLPLVYLKGSVLTSSKLMGLSPVYGDEYRNIEQWFVLD